MNSETSYLNGPAGETWQSALLRFKLFAHTDLMADDEEYEEDDDDREVINLGEYYDDGTLFEISEKELPENITKWEAALGITVPPALKYLMCEHGAFAIYFVSMRFGRWGERKCLEINASPMADIDPNIKPLCAAIANNYSDHFTEQELSAEQISYLNSNYFCFGSIAHDDQDREYLYFDRQHNFGSFRFEDEDYVQNMERLAPLLAGNSTPLGLDALLSASIDKAIELVRQYSLD